MFESVLGFYLGVVAFLIAIAGVFLASWTLFEIRRCRRIDFYNIVQLICAGSAIALGLEHGVF